MEGTTLPSLTEYQGVMLPGAAALPDTCAPGNGCMAEVPNDYRVNGRRSVEHVQRRFDLHLKPSFANRRVTRMTQISTSLLREYITHRQAGGAAAASINRELAIVKRAFVLTMQAGS